MTPCTAVEERLWGSEATEICNFIELLKDQQMSLGIVVNPFRCQQIAFAPPAKFAVLGVGRQRPVIDFVHSPAPRSECCNRRR